jgi:integrase
LRAARTDTSLPRDRPPTTAVEWNEELPREVGIDDWRAWRAAWDKIENPTRKAYHLFALLTGARPGEAARLRVDALDAKRRTLTIKKSKTGINVTIPLSVGIVQVLRMARRARGDDPSPYVFPARGPKGHPIRFDKDGLPEYANVLRHTYISIAASLGIDELTQTMLTTHAPRGVHQRYFVRMILSSGPAMRAAQAKISRKTLDLLHIKSRDLR